MSAIEDWLESVSVAFRVPVTAVETSSVAGRHVQTAIVATSLDNQHPESKSVVNMVHRIQNRNTGYSDFGSNGSTTQFSFSGNTSNPVSHGANALKLENEVVSENFNESVNDVNNEYHKEFLKNQEVESIVENTQEENEISFSQEALETSESDQDNSADLKEFGVEVAEPDLFNSDNKDSASENLLGSNDEDQEEDDLEIPAFLRRQKN